MAEELAAAVGEPLAPRFWAEVEANQEHERLEDDSEAL